MNVLLEALTSSKKYSRHGKALYSSGYIKKPAVQASSLTRMTVDEVNTQFKQLQHELAHEDRRRKAGRQSPPFLSPPRKPLAAVEYPSLFTEGQHLDAVPQRSKTPCERRRSLKVSGSLLPRRHSRVKVSPATGAEDSFANKSQQKSNLTQSVPRGVAFKKQSTRQFLPLNQVNEHRFINNHVDTELQLKFRRVACTKFRSLSREKGSGWQQVLTYALNRSPSKPQVDLWSLRYIRSQSRLTLQRPTLDESHKHS